MLFKSQFSGTESYQASLPSFLIRIKLKPSMIKMPQTTATIDVAISISQRGALSFVANSVLLLKVLAYINLAPRELFFY